MISAPATALEAGIHAVVVASGFLIFGYLVADVIAARWELDRVSRWGLALPGAALWVAVVMLAHIVTGGEVLSNAWVARGLTLVVGVGLAARAVRRRRERRPEADLRIAAACALVAVAVWGSPVFRMLPLPTDADTKLHMGWATQLMNGESTPSATVTGDVPNYYPWLFHGSLALAARFTPGGHAGHALAPLQLMLLAGGALSLFALGRKLGGSWVAGTGAVVFGIIAGGYGSLGWRSYNLAHHNLAPPYPRDLAFALVGGFLLCLVIGVEARRAGPLVGAGAVLGLIGLSGTAFFVALPVAVVVSLFPLGMSRRAVAVPLLLPALVVYGLWALPIAINYVRFDGFVNTTHLEPVTLGFWDLVGAFGVVIPFAAIGGLRLLPRAKESASARAVLALLAVAVAIVAGAGLVPELFGDEFLSIGRHHRYWPLIYLALALLAAIGLARVVEYLSARGAATVAASGVLVAAIVLPPPVRASADLPHDEAKSESYLTLSNALQDDDDSVFNVLARAGDGPCIAAVPASLSRQVFAYTGYRLVLWIGTAEPPNRARIRWEEIAEAPPTDAQRAADNASLTQGGEEWQSAADRYGVNLVVAPSRRTDSSAFAGLPRTPAVAGEKDYLVVEATPC